MDTGCNHAGISIATYLENVPQKKHSENRIKYRKKSVPLQILKKIYRDE